MLHVLNHVMNKAKVSSQEYDLTQLQVIQVMSPPPPSKLKKKKKSSKRCLFLRAGHACIVN